MRTGNKGNGSNSAVKMTFTIQNKLGLHARAASQFVQLTNKFNADIMVIKGRHEVNGKSIMGIMMLAAAMGSRITVKAKGSDAHDAIDAIGRLINDKFGEEQ